MERRSTKAALFYHQISKLKYTQTNDAKYCNRNNMTFEFNFHSLENIITIFLLAFLSVVGKPLFTLHLTPKIDLVPEK